MLSFQNPELRGFECKKEKMSPKSGQFFILDLFLPLLVCLLRFDLRRKKSSQHCTFGRLHLLVNRLLQDEKPSIGLLNLDSQTIPLNFLRYFDSFAKAASLVLL